MRHVYKNPVGIEVNQIARITPGCVNIPKYALYICVPKQRTLFVASSITMK
jgi:hypothetical protein